MSICLISCSTDDTQSQNNNKSGPQANEQSEVSFTDENGSEWAHLGYGNFSESKQKCSDHGSGWGLPPKVIDPRSLETLLNDSQIRSILDSYRPSSRAHLFWIEQQGDQYTLGEASEDITNGDKRFDHILSYDPNQVLSIVCFR